MAQSNKKNLLVRDTLVLGLGLMDMTRDKVDKLVSEVTKGISKQDKKKAVDHLFKYASDTRKKAKDAVLKQIKKALDELDSELKKKDKTKKKKKSKKKRA
jgi:polyhydroxyalkanoate synthesis regulator phasin